jgi:hypothetical protein
MLKTTSIIEFRPQAATSTRNAFLGSFPQDIHMRSFRANAEFTPRIKGLF